MPPPPGQSVGSFDPSWSRHELDALSAAVGFDVLQPPANTIKLPAELTLAGIRILTPPGSYFHGFRIERTSGDPVEVPFPDSGGESHALTEEIALGEITAIRAVTKGKDNPANNATVFLKLKSGATELTLGVPFVIPMAPAIANVVGFTRAPSGGLDLRSHLMANRLHYSQAIWRNLDSATLALLLSPYKYNGLPVAQIIDPVPVTVAGNFLVFRMHADPVHDADWRGWLEAHGIDRALVKQEIVPLPSGGVFAEAVLGRYNSAEKLDLSRFWNWQDSPIPHAAPEIAAITAASRAQPEDIKPGQLGSPIVNIVEPTKLPDPVGMSEILKAVQNGNMFRDMSNLQAMAEMAKAAMQAAAKSASNASTQAGTNMSTYADFMLEAFKAALPLLAASMGAPGAGATNNPTVTGALANAAKKQKEEAPATPPAEDKPAPGGDSPGGDGSSGSGPASGGTTAPAGSGVTLASSPGFSEVDVLQSAIGGQAVGGALGVLRTFLQQVLAAAPPPAPPKPVLILGQRVPNLSEGSACGAIASKIVRGTPEFAKLVKNTNPDIVFKTEEGTDADQMMSLRMKEKLDVLAELVKNEWPGKKLRVTEVWDENNEHNGMSLHYEGRAADITVSDVDGAKLGRLGQLAVDAGFDWVWYENAMHVHVSVQKDPVIVATPPARDMDDHQQPGKPPKR